MTVRLTKHQGLGNDFLVHLSNDPDEIDRADWWSRAQRWCDRSTGVGADGLLLGLWDQPGADLTMTLYNADGSLAEMSGNGIRCLVQAEAMRRHETTGRLLVETGGGLRAVGFRPGTDPGTGWPTGSFMEASVDMEVGS